ncbi:MAG: hypothetical protein N3D10_00145 [Candidatus Micrarchaeota archaeon]|nr:hypothetical protein [Candidatus Micrarchaeota archaeon]
MEKSKILLISILFLFLILGIGLYWFGVSSKYETNKQEPIKELSAEERAILDRYKLEKKEDYSFLKGIDNNGKKESIIIVKNKNEINVKNKNEIYELALYEDLKEQNKVLCIKLLDLKQQCVKIEQKSFTDDENKTVNIFEELKKEIDVYPKAEEKELVEFLIENKILTFLQKLEQEKIGEQNCKVLNYEIDYKKITLDKISYEKTKNINWSEIGLGYIDKVRIKECYDFSSNTIVYKEMNYTDVFGNEYKYKLNITPIEQKIEQLTQNSKVEDVVKTIEKAVEIKEELEGCFARSVNKRGCYFNLALTQELPQLCQLAKDVENATEECYYQYAIRKGAVDFCSYTKEREDECYIDYVYLNRDKRQVGYCNKIKNQTLYKECLKIFEEKVS